MNKNESNIKLNNQRILDLKGFGPKSEDIFAQVNVHSVEDFFETEPFTLYANLKRSLKGTGLNSIYAILGAREGVHWQEIKRTRKTEILMRLDEMGLAPK